MKSIKNLVWAMLLSAIPAMAASHSATLTWTPGADDTGFNVYRSSAACPTTAVTTTTAGFSKIGSATSPTYVDSTVTVGLFCYFVTGTAGGAESAPSNDVNVAITPFAPTVLTVIAQ
jgi:hypothetical protein